MKKSFRITALLLALALCLSMLAACGGTGDAESQTPETQSPEIQSPEVQEPEVQEPETQEPETQGPVEEPEEEDEEEYVFEGPGILDSMAAYPDSYNLAATQQGRTEKVTYNNGVEEKYFIIYLPYGYDTSDQNYNVLYLMHGGNGKPETYLKEGGATLDQRVVDNMIQNGDMDPLIMVAVSWNSSVSGTDGDTYDTSMALAERFAAEELAQYVIPLVDGNYRTNATREGRAFSGFSMGGVTTWYTFLHALDYIKYFLPFSGDCWVLGKNAAATLPEETVAILEQSVADQGYTTEDFLIFAATGTQDIAMPNLAPQIYAMQDSDVFIFGENTYFGAYPDGSHSGLYARIYMYNALLMLWQGD